MEIWKDIKGYEDYYQVSNLGRIKSLERKVERQHSNGTLSELTIHERILSNRPSMNGYITNQLSVSNTNIRYKTHRLVAITFIENPKHKPDVTHIDGIKTNNKISNLKWVNINGRSYNQGKDHYRSRSIVMINYKTKKIIKEFESITLASVYNNISRTFIIKLCNMNYEWNGFIFQYKK